MSDLKEKGEQIIQQVSDSIKSGEVREKGEQIIRQVSDSIKSGEAKEKGEQIIRQVSDSIKSGEAKEKGEQIVQQVSDSIKSGEVKEKGTAFVKNTINECKKGNKKTIIILVAVIVLIAILINTCASGGSNNIFENPSKKETYYQCDTPFDNGIGFTSYNPEDKSDWDIHSVSPGYYIKFYDGKAEFYRSSDKNFEEPFLKCDVSIVNYKDGSSSAEFLITDTTYKDLMGELDTDCVGEVFTTNIVYYSNIFYQDGKEFLALENEVGDYLVLEELD